MKRANPNSSFRLAMVATAMVLAVPAAHALTFETKNYTDDSYLRYSDPDKKVEQFLNGDGQKTAPNGSNFQFYMGPAKDNVFGRPGGQFQPAWGPQALPDPR